MYAASLGGKQRSCLVALCILSLHHPSANSAGAKTVYDLSSRHHSWQASNPAELVSGSPSSGIGYPEPVAPFIPPACSPTLSTWEQWVEASYHTADTRTQSPAAGPPESQGVLSVGPRAAPPTAEEIAGAEDIKTTEDPGDLDTLTGWEHGVARPRVLLSREFPDTQHVEEIPGAEDGKTTEDAGDLDTPTGWEYRETGLQRLQSRESPDTELVEEPTVFPEQGPSINPQALEQEVTTASPQEQDSGALQIIVPSDTTQTSGWALGKGGATSNNDEPGGSSQDSLTWSQTFSKSQGSLQAQSPPWDFQPAAKHLSSTESWLKLIARVLGKVNAGEDKITPGAAVPEVVMPDPGVADHPTLPLTKGNEGEVVMLIHGGIQGGWVWCYPRPELGAPRGVRGILEDQGYRVFTPTLPFHEPYSTWNKTYIGVRASTYVQAIIDTFVQHDLHNVTLVGHSLAGVWLQLTLQQIPERINRLIFCNAAVLLSGESFATNALGQPGQVGFTGFAAFPFFPYPINGSFSAAGIRVADPRACADLFVWEDLLMSNFQGNRTIIYDTYAKLVPEPRAPMLEFFDLMEFYKIPKPKYFVWHTQDFGLPIPTAWLGFAERLRLSPTGGSPVKVFTVDANHEAMISSPDKFSFALLEAIRAT